MQKESIMTNFKIEMCQENLKDKIFFFLEG